MIIHHLTHEQLDSLVAIFAKPRPSADGNYIVYPEPDWIKLLRASVRPKLKDIVAYAAIDSQLGEL